MLLFPPKKNHLMRGTKCSAPLEANGGVRLNLTRGLVLATVCCNFILIRSIGCENLNELVKGKRLLNGKSFSCALIMTLFVQL